MYRYGDGTPFPLDENFIETLTTAVETCTNAFVPLTNAAAEYPIVLVALGLRRALQSLHDWIEYILTSGSAENYETPIGESVRKSRKSSRSRRWRTGTSADFD